MARKYVVRYRFTTSKGPEYHQKTVMADSVYDASMKVMKLANLNPDVYGDRVLSVNLKK